MIAQQDVKFYGASIKRVTVICHKIGATIPSQQLLEFIQKNLNNLRNYREFTSNEPVETSVYKSDSLPRISLFKEGDACLIIGCGRFVDKASYQFAKKCFKQNVPVFFIRSNSIEVDARRENMAIWHSIPLVTKLPAETRCVNAPEKYFMEIPDISHIIPLKDNNDFYALLPAMVPIS